jgi:hypothetical protein
MNIDTSSIAASTVGDTIAETSLSPRTTTAPAPAPPIPAPRPAKVALSFIARSSDKNLVVATSKIINAMTGNAHYPTPAPTLAAVTAANDALLAAVNVPHNSKLTVATRRQLRTPLAVLLRQLAQYVQTTGDGDPVVLLGSGFPLQRGPQPVGILPAPANLRLSRGKVSGQLAARCNMDAQAAAYEWRIASALAPTLWLPANPTVAARATLQGLMPGTQYVVQVRAIGSKGPSDWSVAAAQIAM